MPLRKKEVDVGRAERFFKAAMRVDTGKVGSAKMRVELDRPLKERAKQLARELRVPPGLVYNALYYCAADPQCDPDQLVEQLKREGDRQRFLLQFLARYGVEA
jgi:hypothetical protein